MNTQRLAKWYEVLTPWERVPLIVAAAVRGDEAEADRLAESAPTSTFRVPNYYGLSQGLRQLANSVLLTLLDLALASSETLAESSTDREGPTCPSRSTVQAANRLLLKMLAYRVVVILEGWRRLCASLHLPPEALLRDLPGHDRVVRLERQARRHAFTAEQALVYLRRAHEATPNRGPIFEGHREYCLQSAEEVAQEMRTFLAGQLAQGM